MQIRKYPAKCKLEWFLSGRTQWILWLQTGCRCMGRNFWIFEMFLFVWYSRAMRWENDENMQQWHQDEYQVKSKCGGLYKKLFCSWNIISDKWSSSPADQHGLISVNQQTSNIKWQALPVLTSHLLAPIARQNTSNLCGLAAGLVECGHTTWGRDKQSFCLYSLIHQVQTNCTSPVFSSGRISRSFFFFPLTFY